MPKCKKVFKESKEVPSPPFTRNSLIIKRIAKKVKGEGLKTLFYIYAVSYTHLTLPTILLV